METQTNHNFIIITGGPGMGKTSIIEELEQKGYGCFPESGRQIIQTELKSGGSNLPWKDQQGFAMEMFKMAIADYDQASNHNILSFFDRGLPDVIGYLRLCGFPVPDELWTAAKTFRYHQKVFITPPWPEIYVNDEERKQSFEEAKTTFDVMLDVYRQLGYSLIEIPKWSVKERVRFILDHIKTNNTGPAVIEKPDDYW